MKPNRNSKRENWKDKKIELLENKINKIKIKSRIRIIKKKKQGEKD